MLVDQSARVWAMRRDDVMASQALQLRAAVANGEVEAISAGDRLEGSDFARVTNGVAVIPVKGPLMRAFSWWAWSYEEIGRDLALAQASNLVRAIVLDIDSPGGLVSGCCDLAQAIRTSGPKPVEAFVGGMAASAAYWLASSAAKVRVGSGAERPLRDGLADLACTSDVSDDIKSFANSLTHPYCGINSNFEAAKWLDESHTITSLTMIPLRHDDACFGLLVLGSPDPTRYTAEMGVEFLEQLGDITGAALARLRT